MEEPRPVDRNSLSARKGGIVRGGNGCLQPTAVASGEIVQRAESTVVVYLLVVDSDAWFLRERGSRTPRENAAD